MALSNPDDSTFRRFKLEQLFIDTILLLDVHLRALMQGAQNRRPAVHVPGHGVAVGICYL